LAEKALVTGGAGFIGSHIVDALVKQGHDVRVFDNLEPQVHRSLREEGRWPDYCSLEVEYVLGDVRDREALSQAMAGVDVIFHEAAMVGVGQSMYQVERYIDVNARGTAILLDLLANETPLRDRVRKLIVASSMSIYGEGKYSCADHGVVFPSLRSEEQLAKEDWEMRCPICGRHVESLPTDEEKPLAPTSTYAISKRDQEELCLAVGQAYNIPIVALRYFNTFGSRQSLSNPYTGVAAIFATRLLNNKPAVIFEDGAQSRDFIHVSDVVQANLLAMSNPDMDYRAFNVGSGSPITIAKVAHQLVEHLEAGEMIETTHEYRAGDIRHCYADNSLLRSRGFRPALSFADGLHELVTWQKEEEAIDRFDTARQELEARGLTSAKIS